MNAGNTAEECEIIAMYGLRSHRRRTRATRKEFSKWLRKVDRENAKLNCLAGSLGWEPLIPPVQKGWKRSFVLRSDIAKGPYSAFFDELLKVVNTYQWSDDGRFVKRKRKFGRKYYLPRTQELRDIHRREFEKLGKDQQQFFHEKFVYERNGLVRVRFVFAEPWRFILRIEPNIINRVRRRDAGLESAIQAIRNYLQRNNLTHRMLKEVDGKVCRWRSDLVDTRRVKPLKNKPVYRIIDELKEENL